MTTKAKAGTQDRRLYGLIDLAALMALGHHIDHVIRGNHVGWPLNEEVNAFTYSLAIYPVLLIGLYLYRSHRVGPSFWVFLSAGGALFVGFIHFGPAAVEPPPDIIDHYEPRFLGWLAFGWLVAFIGGAGPRERVRGHAGEPPASGARVAGGQTDRRCGAVRADQRPVRIAVGAGLALRALAVLGEALARSPGVGSLCDRASHIRTERREID